MMPRSIRAAIAALLLRAHRAVASLPIGPLALAAVAAVAAYALSIGVFPYHSTNHDEAVYLQQAAMLLDGQLFLQPPVEDAFRPWFFVDSAAGLFPKYAPPTAAIYALGGLAGSFRYALPAVAAANVALLYGVVREAFDRRTGLLAGVAFVCSPLFLVQSAVFLPYAPTTMLNLAFAFAYFRAERESSARWAAVAGGATGLAFFARPYTAVLFAAPFIVHALWTLRGPLRALAESRVVVPTLRRRIVTATVGLCGVALALAYNAVVTGDPLVFPYQAFAPLDGLGFGHREILDHERDYTVGVALRANARVARAFLLEWAPFGALGSALAVVGGYATHRRGWAWRRVVLAGVAGSVLLGNVYFWGNLNVLGSLGNPDDGLIATLGPYYQFDMLVPASAFAAVGILAVVDRARHGLRDGIPDARARPVAVAILLVTATVLGGAVVVTAAEPIRENAARTDHYETAYEPFEPHPPEDAVVFLPEPYGEWLNHPFQALRNDPGFDGRTVYALQENQLAVAAAYPDRELHRYVYRGSWSPGSGEPVESDLRRVHVAAGDPLIATVEMGLPDWTQSAMVALSTGDDRVYYAIDDASSTGSATVEAVVDDGRVGLDGPVTPTDDRTTVPLAGSGSVTVDVHVDGGYGAGFSYRARVPVEETNDGYRALTPYRELCTDLRNCGGGAAYVPGAGPDGASLNSSVRAA